MSLAGFLTELERRQVELRVEGGSLRCSAPEGVLTPDLVAAIRVRRAEILRHLRGRDAIGPVDRSATLPLSFAQERLWLLNHLEPEDSAYHIPLVVRLPGRLQSVALRHSLAEVARRHEVLRTCYPARRGRPCQEVGTSPPLPALVDLTGLSPAGKERAIRVLAEQAARRPFDLAAAPPMRTFLLHCGPTDHLLLITRHHIASDGWSFGVLGAELSALYAAYICGAPSPLPELPFQYADFAWWQRQVADSATTRAQLDRWTRRLEGAPPTVGLISGRRRSASAPTPAGTQRRVLSGANCQADGQRLAEAAREAGTTVFTLLLAALGVVVAAAAGQREVVIGSPVAGRPRRELESLIGCFATMLPLRLDLSGDPSFREVLRRVHDVVVEALANQDVPLERMVDAVRPQRTLIGGSPLFSVAFTYQNTPQVPVRLPGLAAVVEEPVPVAPKFPLTLTAAAEAGGHSLVAEFDAELIHPEAVAALLDRFVAVLALACARPEDRCADLVREAAASSAAELEPVPDEPGNEQTLGSVFEATAAHVPDAIAVSSGDSQVSYGFLHARARRLAARLAAVGAEPESLVATCVHPSVDSVVAILGISLAGAAYLPLDPEDPPARHEAVIGDARIAALVAEPRTVGALAWYEGPTLLVTDEPAEETTTVPGGGLVPDNLAYVIYTSGSTGAPKGVMVSHRNVISMFAAANTVFGFSQADVWTLVHSSAFDFSVWEIWGALLHGARLVVLDRATARDPGALWEVVRGEGVTLFSSTPSAFHALVPATPAGNRRRTALRAVVLGGERCDPDRLVRWLEDRGDEQPQLVNMYGITETTVHVTACRITAGKASTVGESPIGRPMPGMHGYVVDRHRVPTTTGGRGELLVGGCGVARGYLRRPGLTADRFRPDNLGAEPGGRLYTSGDVVRLMPHGDLCYLGRLDQQIKVRGYRIEPGEVEAALVSHSDIATAAVTVRRNEDRSYLVGYVVPPAGDEPSGTELRRFLSERLPPYMVPAAFVALDRLPLTRNGKLDYDALPPPGETDVVAVGTPPRTPTERMLAAMWCELIGVESVGINDNFFELGGDSLLVTRLHARLPAAFGVDVPMRQVYQALDIASLAEAIDDLRADAAGVTDTDLLRLAEEMERMPRGEPQRRLS